MVIGEQDVACHVNASSFDTDQNIKKYCDDRYTI